MSIFSKTTRKLRIVAIPLTRPKLATQSNAPANRILTYYQFQISPVSQNTSNASSDSRSSWVPEGGIGKWITSKAADTWASFGKAKGGWKLKVYEGGERLVDRLEFEELALKGIDPSLGPNLAGSTNSTAGVDNVQHQIYKIPLLYPPSIQTGSATLNELSSLVAYRTPRHRKGFYVWMTIAPFTAPFMIIPIIPNLPFFFCAWRSWSHYKAYRASQYLQSLLDSGAIVPEPSEALDAVYQDFAPQKHLIASSTTTGSGKTTKENDGFSQSSTPQQHDLLLTRDAVPAILTSFGLQPSSGADLLRAVEQARVRVRSGRGIL